MTRGPIASHIYWGLLVGKTNILLTELNCWKNEM